MISLLILVSYVASYVIPTINQWTDGQITTMLVGSQHNFGIGFEIGDIISDKEIHCEVDLCLCNGQILQFECYSNQSILIQSNITGSAFLLGNPFKQKRLTQSTTVVPYNDSDLKSLMTITPNLYIKWTINDDNTFDFAVSYLSTGYIGFGLRNSMSNTDMWIFYQQNNQVNVIDTWSRGQDTPATDKQQDLKIVSYSVNSTGYSVRINRKLNTGDASQDMILANNTNYTFCFAYSGDQCIQYQYLVLVQHTYYAGFNIQFANGLQSQAVLILGADLLFYVHAVLFYICWAFIADFGIIIGRFFKNVNTYVWIHAICFIIVDFCTIIIMIVILTKGIQSSGNNLSSLKEPHAIIGFIILITVIIQHIGGIVTKHILEDNTRQNKEFVLKMKKGHAILGTLIYLLAKTELIIGLCYNQNTILLVLGVIWIALLIVARILLEAWWATRQRGISAKIVPSGKSLNHDQMQLIKLLQANTPTTEIMQTMPNLIWCIYNEDVYDLTGFQHPGGNFLIKSIQGREVSRFIHGAYDLENTTATKHMHSQIALNLLAARYIGSLPISEKHPTISHNTWQIIQKTEISKNIMQFELSNKSQIQLNQPFSEFGKHYIVSMTEFGSKVRMYTKVLSMSKPCVDYRDKLIKYYENSSQEVPKIIQVQSETLPLIIKRYNYNDALSKELFETTKTVYLSGPYGRGLELEDGQVFAFAGGTGILPYLDLLDYLLQKSIHLALQKAGKSSHFEDNGPKIQLKLIATFANESEFIGKDWIRKLYQINQTHQLGLFDMIIRYSNKTLDEVIPKFEGRFTIDFVSKQIVNACDNQILICGPPSMNHSLLEILGSAKRVLII